MRNLFKRDYVHRGLDLHVRSRADYVVGVRVDEIFIFIVSRVELVVEGVVEEHVI
jgi:hypothetical protein